MVPGRYLEEYLGLTGGQRKKLDALMKTIDALDKENYITPALAQLKLTDAQIQKIAAGEAVRSVLTGDQKQILDANQRRGFGGPGGFGGPPPGQE
jgi:hypothetical protein